jgi:hypothetical protein
MSITGSQSYRAIDDAIIKLSTLSFDNDSAMKESKMFLLKVQGGRLKTELKDARLHCTEIEAIYNRKVKK